MAALKSDYGLLDLPAEILDLVLSYVPDVELINVQKVSVQFEQSYRRLICRKGKKLNFSRCFHLREEDMMPVLRLGKNYITSVNINHCYWLKSNCLKFIMKLPKLQELHMIDCGTSSSVNDRLVPVGLSALSFSLDETWSKFLMCKLGSAHAQHLTALFENLKQLTIHVEGQNPYPSHHYIGVVVLKYCLQLETLTVYESGVSSHLPYALRTPPPDHPDGLLPKLSKLRLQLNTCKTSSDGVLHWVKDIFLRRKTLLNEVCLGKVSYNLLEYDSELTLPCIIAEELPEVCLVSSDHSHPELPAIPKIWMGSKMPKCKVVSLQGLSLKWMSDTSTLVAQLGPRLQELNLRNCKVEINYLVTGLTTIAKHCTQLTKLDLTLHSSLATNDDFNDKLLMAVSEFKALKVLYMSVGLLIRSKNLPNPKTLPGQQKYRIGSQMEIFEESMRSSGMWILTQSCMKIEDFRITNDTWTDDRVVYESALACISNWKNLKELHLVNIPTLGRGSFLPFITKSCSQLTNLYLANVCHKGTCNYMRSLIESLSFATGLKDLSIIQDMELSSMLLKSLGNCQGLERVYLQTLVIKPEECSGFITLLSKLPKLVFVWVEVKFTTAAVMKLITKKLKSLKSTRPSLTYYIENQALPTSTSKLPHVHLELSCYETA